MSRRLVNWLLAGVLVGFTAWLRAPTWNDHILFIDEPIYYSFAARLQLPDAHVYSHTADQKPPLGPLTYWLAIQISPEHAIAVVHAMTTIAIAVTTVLLLATSTILLGSPWAGFCAGVLYLLITSSAQPYRELFLAFSSLEHFQAPWLIGFVLLFLLGVRRQRGWLAAAAGAALGVAALYKQNVPVLLAPAWVAVALAVKRGRLSWRSGAWLAGVTAAATLAVIMAVPLYYAAIGHFAAWRFYNIDALLLYHSVVPGSATEKMNWLAYSIPLKPFLIAGLLSGAFAFLLVDRSDWTGELGVLLATGWLALFASLVPGLFKPHYMIQGLPSECLLLGVLVVQGWRMVARLRGRIRLAGATLYLALLLVPLGVAGVRLYQSWDWLRAYAGYDSYLDLHRRQGTLGPLLDYIRSHSTPDDLIYVHSEAPEFYFLTQRLPAVSDPTGSWIALTPWPETADWLLGELEASPPKLIVELDYRRYGRERETLEKWPQIRAWVRGHYQRFTLTEHATVYQWKGPTPPDVSP